MEAIALEKPTRTLYLYGKNGKAQGPTKAYPHSRAITITAELVKDFGDGVAVWKYPANEKEDTEKFWVLYYNNQGHTNGGGECRSLEDALDRAERSLVFREYSARKREMYQEFNEQLAALEAEYKGRI